MNLVLAVVYSNFSEEEKKKFYRLWKHERKFCFDAFDQLSDPRTGTLNAETFIELALSHDHNLSRKDAFLRYKSLCRVRESGLGSTSSCAFPSCYTERRHGVTHHLLMFKLPS